MSVLTENSIIHPSQVSAEPISQRSETLVIFAAIAVFSLMSITMAIISRGFLEGDACSHYLTAKAAYANPSYLLSVWGRPICTGLYELPAHFGGRLAVRLTSLVVAIAIALITRSIAVGQGWKWPALALIFLLAQPLVFLHSFSELTELPFALLIAAGFLAYQRRQFFWMALILGLGPLSRPEGFGFLGLTLMALLLHRRWWWMIVAIAPLIIWDYVGWRVNGSHGVWWHWLQDNWPYAAESLYERGPLLYFVSVMPAVISPFIFPAAVVGGFICLGSLHSSTPVNDDYAFNKGSTTEPSRTRGSKSRDQNLPPFSVLSVPRWLNFLRIRNHANRCEILIVILPLIILIGHSLLYWRGKMASNGEVRYMMVVAPFWALLSARGWTWIFDEMNWKRPLLWACFAAMLPVLVNRAWTVIPTDNGPDWLEAEQIAKWYKTSGIANQYPYLEISHVGLQYALNLDPESGQIREWKKSVIDSRPPGTLLIWDRIGALFNSDSQRKIPLDEIRSAGWKPLKTFWTGGAGDWQFFESDPIKK